MSLKDVISSDELSVPSEDGLAPIDRLTPVLERFRVQASLFHSGPLCGHQVFDAKPGRGFLHVLRRGEMEMLHGQGPRKARTHLSEPTLLLFPRAVHHEFINPPVDGSDFTCATLDFDGGARNPIVQSLPDVIALPLERIDGLSATLDLLFAESDRVRCGSRLLVNRLFEVVLIQVLRWIIDHPDQAQVSQGMMMGLSDPRLAKALIAVHRAPDADWTLERMAANAGMSRSAFAAAFKAATGTTPAAYSLDWKLNVATSLLRAGRSVKQVALDLGFADAPSLSRAFRRRTGSSPREWLTLHHAAGPGTPQSRFHRRRGWPVRRQPMKRKPTPGSVAIQRGAAALSPSFCRSLPTRMRR